tara:strand:+ start:751 stop:933 length:183 start_codon:yes stop_codon:yes gene_type:complete
MKETIQIIKDLASLTDNVYLLDKITLLEQQIPTDIEKLRLEKKIIILQKKIDKLNNYKKP